MHIQDSHAAATALEAKAVAEAGLSDFGERSYRAGLEAYMSALAGAGIGEADRAAAIGQALNILVTRLRTVDQMKRNAKALDRQIVAPLFILGLPRTGTTALHHLLARDPRFQELEFWIGTNPMPRPPRDSWEDTAELAKARAEIAELYQAVPEFRAIHHVTAEGPEECRMLMEHTFASTALAWAWDVPQYSEWLSGADLTDQYRYYADALRLIGANDPERTWLLKCPHHTLSLKALLAVFPDARIVFTHRDPMDVVPSNCSLAATLKQWPKDDLARRHALGARLLDSMDVALRRALEIRDQHPENFINVTFRDLRRDPLETVRKIYAHFGIDLTDEVTQAMEDWITAEAANPVTGHRYTVEDFGLTREQVRERFSYYHEY